MQDEQVGDSIGYLFKNLSKPSKQSAIITSRSLSLRYSNQLLRTGSSQKLTWNQLMSHTGVIRKGPIPIWFNEFSNSNNMIGRYGPIPNQLATF